MAQVGPIPRSGSGARYARTNSEGNHGEDVKEYNVYLDSTPTHSYMKYLYKYPQAAFPYADLVGTNKRPPWGYHVFEVTSR